MERKLYTKPQLDLVVFCEDVLSISYGAFDGFDNVVGGEGNELDLWR